MFDKLQGIEITSISSHNATVVEIVYVHPEFGTIVSTGCAKRHPDDRADNLVGYGLALSRALNSLSRKIERRARGRMNDMDQRAKARLARIEAAKNHPAAKGKDKSNDKDKDDKKKSKKAEMKPAKRKQARFAVLEKV
jgi:hypothetical protein